jgi:hypothetical protein
MTTLTRQTIDDYAWWTATEMGHRLGLDFNNHHQRLVILQDFIDWANNQLTETRNKIRDHNIPDPWTDMPY